MSEPVVFRLIRPYDSADEFIVAEGWTLNRRGIVLLDQAELPAATVVRFDLRLRSGERLILAEGMVVGVLAARADRPGGLKVRFTRFGASTKDFIDRVVEVQEKGRIDRTSTAEIDPPLSAPSAAPTDPSPPAPPERSSPIAAPVAAAVTPASPASRVPTAPRNVRVVNPPPHREQLLESLRQRHARRTGSSR